MNVAVYQPYFFPYLGYWQLFNAVDKFIILDDVNYIKRGFINSNSILINGQIHKFTLSVKKPSQNKLINETQFFFPQKEKEDFLKTITMAYRKSDAFDSFFPILESIVMYDENDVTQFLHNSFEIIKQYVGIKTEILISSNLKKDTTLKGEQRIIEICKRVGADCYINAIGGTQLYDWLNFDHEGIDLKFLRTLDYEYKQQSKHFVSGLSFIDVLMNNDKEYVHELLGRYELIQG